MKAWRIRITLSLSVNLTNSPNTNLLTSASTWPTLKTNLTNLPGTSPSTHLFKWLGIRNGKSYNKKEKKKKRGQVISKLLSLPNPPKYSTLDMLQELGVVTWMKRRQMENSDLVSSQYLPSHSLWYDPITGHQGICKCCLSCLIGQN